MPLISSFNIDNQSNWKTVDMLTEAPFIKLAHRLIKSPFVCVFISSITIANGNQHRVFSRPMHDNMFFNINFNAYERSSLDFHRPQLAFIRYYYSSLTQRASRNVPIKTSNPSIVESNSALNYVWQTTIHYMTDTNQKLLQNVTHWSALCFPNP